VPYLFSNASGLRVSFLALGGEARERVCVESTCSGDGGHDRQGDECELPEGRESDGETGDEGDDVVDEVAHLHTVGSSTRQGSDEESGRATRKLDGGGEGSPSH
jgi:hypothetical protein